MLAFWSLSGTLSRVSQLGRPDKALQPMSLPRVRRREAAADLGRRAKQIINTDLWDNPNGPHAMRESIGTFSALALMVYDDHKGSVWSSPGNRGKKNDC